MSPAERQRLIDNISAEDLAKVQRKISSHIKVGTEDLLLAEFAIKFGWGAYKDVRRGYYETEDIEMIEFMKLIEASRKLESLQLYKQAQAVLVGAGSAQSKNPSSSFTKMTQKLLKDARADD